MKKYLLMATMIILVLLPGTQTLAQENKIESRGNIEGIVNIYSNDIRYLENEINELLKECKEDTYYE